MIEFDIQNLFEPQYIWDNGNLDNYLEGAMRSGYYSNDGNGRGDGWFFFSELLTYAGYFRGNGDFD